MLAIVFDLEKWHQYTYQCKVVIFPNHTLLDAIISLLTELAYMLRYTTMRGRTCMFLKHSAETVFHAWRSAKKHS